jgi:L-cysteine/cystine lyase
MSDSIGRVVSPFMPDEEKVAAIREALPATGAGIYLNTGTAGPIPRETAAAMAELAGWELTTGRAHAAFIEDAADRRDEARAAAAAVVHADLDAIALMHSTTDGINAVLWSLDWSAEDVLVTTDLEYAGVAAAVDSLAARRGVAVRRVAGSGEVLDAALERALDGPVRMVVLSQIAYGTGELLPVSRVLAAARALPSDPLVVVDGAQAAGAMAVDIEELGADAYAFPAHKWLLGPEGMGALVLGPRALDRQRPAFGGIAAAQGATGARRFEWSNFHAPSVLGMARSCGWLSMYIGLPWLTDRSSALARQTYERLAATAGVTMVTPSDRLATLITFRLDSWAAADALDEIGRRTFAIARVVDALDAIRISVGFFNTTAELSRFCEVVEEIAAHTPDTLPRRPALTILGG